MAKRIDAPRMRQGEQGYPVLVMLVVLLGLAALIWLGVEVYSQYIASGG
jgi:hypothetical protein